MDHFNKECVKEQELNLQEKIKLHEIKQQQAVANKEEMMKRKIEEQRKYYFFAISFMFL